MLMKCLLICIKLLRRSNLTLWVFTPLEPYKCRNTGNCFILALAVFIPISSFIALVTLTMEVRLINSFCFRSPLRTGCLVVGWFDIVYGHTMVLVYLVSMYSGYFYTSGVIWFVLWLGFVFTIIKILEGAILVYGVKYYLSTFYLCHSSSNFLMLFSWIFLNLYFGILRTIGLVLLSAVVGVLVMIADVVGDVMLTFSETNMSAAISVVVGVILVILLGIRGYMTFAVYSYYTQLKDELYLRNKLHDTIPDIIQNMS